jgi:hypothetical protein
MAIHPKLWSKQRVQAIAQFLNRRNENAAETHPPVKVNKNDVMRQQNTAKWCAHFTSERISTGNVEINGSHTMTTTPNKTHVTNAIPNSRRIMVGNPEYDIGLSRETARIRVPSDVCAVATVSNVTIGYRLVMSLIKVLLMKNFRLEQMNEISCLFGNTGKAPQHVTATLHRVLTPYTTLLLNFSLFDKLTNYSKTQ